MTHKKLYLVALFAREEDGNSVVEITEPEWVVETSEDRVKARVLADKLEDDLDWNVGILQTHDFNTVNFQ